MTVDSILLQTGLEVSAKFKGAFCEAKIKSVDPNIKLKIRFPGKFYNSQQARFVLKSL